MGQFLNLESFDNSDSVRPENHPEYLRGFANGHAAGEAAATEAEGIQLRAVNDILDNARFTYAEARQAVLTDLKTVFDITLNQFLPDLATAGLAENLRQHLSRAIENGTPEKIILSVPPDFLSLCESIASNSGATNLVIKSDSQIGDHAVWFNSEQHDVCIDFEHALTAVRNALQCLQSPTHGIAKND